MSLLLNSWLVPKYDINGGAASYALSYAVYTVLLLVFIRWKVRVLPLSGKMFPVLVIVLVLFGLNWAWVSLLTPWFAEMFTKSVYGLLIDAVLKSLLFVTIGLTAIYKLKVSQSINDLIDKVIKR